MQQNNKNKELVNRLVLIGNGFDLAHGLPTKYEDFILFILKRDILASMDQSNVVKTKLYEVKRNLFFESFNLSSVSSIKELSQYIEWVFSDDEDNFSYGYPHIRGDSRMFIERSNKPVTIYSYNRFLKKTLDDISNLTWTGFETQYYNAIIEILNDKRCIDNKETENQYIQSLNIYFQYIKEEFQSYIKYLHTPHIKQDCNILIQSKINCKFSENPNLSPKESQFNDCYPGQILLLNFNYTILTRLYLKRTHFNSLVDQIDIHGQYSDEIVFGYGDEIDENYSKIENKNNNEFLKHFKAFKYFQNSDYSKFLSFINSAPFEVCIMGHSCGLSDRVMLNTIFEHEFCTSIKIYYHLDKSRNIDNYTEITQNISRHFSIQNRAKMREKIVAKDKCVPLIA